MTFNNKLPNFRELRKVTMIIVKEGEGTKDDVIREVKYFFDEENYIGKIDPEEKLS